MKLRFEVYNPHFLSQKIDVIKDLFLFDFVKEPSTEAIELLKKVLHNPVLQDVKMYTEQDVLEPVSIDVLFLPGMTDNVAHSIRSALDLTGLFNESYRVFTGKTYKFLSDTNIEKMATDLINPMTHFYELQINTGAWKFPRAYSTTSSTVATAVEIPLDQLTEWMKERLLALNTEEMAVIKNYFKNELQRNPTDVEIEIIAQTWSEHCKHKIFAANYEYSEVSAPAHPIAAKSISSLFSTYIKSTVKPHHHECVSVFHDNAGVMRWDENIDLCIKAETHNSPSALDPFSGAVTGVLGVQRDIMGTGKGAKPIANMDVFCVGNSNEYPHAGSDEEPLKLLSPIKILKGVHKGVEDGGNKMGVPTINGSFQFHPNFAGKPLVYVGSVGVMPRYIGKEECVNKQIVKGDLVYVGGGRLGRDGIHGATFSSLSLEGEIPTSVVQIGDPITQKKLLDFTVKARDKGWIRGLTDNGAGGVSSSVGELAQYTNGVSIAIDKHPVKYEGLQCFEMVISESQERMTYAIPPEHQKEFEILAKEFGVEVSCLGEFTDHGKFKITYHGKIIADLPLAFLHEACPKMNLQAKWQGPQHPNYWHRNTQVKSPSDLKTESLHLLSSANIVSKEDWVRMYDHEVQGATIGKPFQGKNQSAPSNAGIIDLEMHGGKADTAVAIAHGFSAKLSCYDTYWMAQMAMDECLRNLIASGANPRKIALLDNFCWPNPFLQTSQHRLGQLVRASEAIKDMATLFDLPFISGKDSMKNSFQGKNHAGKTISIDVEPSLLISGMGYVESHLHALPSSFVNSNRSVYFIGIKAKSLLGSEYAYHYAATKDLGEDLAVPQYDYVLAKKVHYKIYELITSGFLESIHDISDGGLLCAILEATIGNQIGISIDTKLDKTFAFGEAPAGYLVSVNKQKQSEFENAIKDIPFEKIGQTQDVFVCTYEDLKITGDEILKAWRTPIC